MIKNIYAIYDKAAECFKFPNFGLTHGESIRQFYDACKDEKQLKNHKEDYSLYFIGEFDDNSGLLIQPETGPTRLATGFEVETLGTLKDTAMHSVSEEIT